MIQILERFKINIQFMKFSIIGLLNTCIDYAIFLLLVYVFNLDLIISNVISYSIAVINSYFFNIFWTFKTKNSFTNFYRFIMLNTSGLILSSIIIILLEDYLVAYYAKLIAILVTVLVNYFGIKIFIANKKE